MRAPPAHKISAQHCSLGVGCDETGVCYASAHGRPDQCGRPPLPGQVVSPPKDPKGHEVFGHDARLPRRLKKRQPAHDPKAVDTYKAPDGTLHRKARFSGSERP